MTNKVRMLSLISIMGSLLTLGGCTVDKLYYTDDPTPVHVSTYRTYYDNRTDGHRHHHGRKYYYEDRHYSHRPWFVVDSYVGTGVVRSAPDNNSWSRPNRKDRGQRVNVTNYPANQSGNNGGIHVDHYSGNQPNNNNSGINVNHYPGNQPSNNNSAINVNRYSGNQPSNNNSAINVNRYSGNQPSNNSGVNVNHFSENQAATNNGVNVNHYSENKPSNNNGINVDRHSDNHSENSNNDKQRDDDAKRDDKKDDSKDVRNIERMHQNTVHLQSMRHSPMTGGLNQINHN